MGVHRVGTGTGAGTPGTGAGATVGAAGGGTDGVEMVEDVGAVVEVLATPELLELLSEGACEDVPVAGAASRAATSHRPSRNRIVTAYCTVAFRSAATVASTVAKTRTTP